MLKNRILNTTKHLIKTIPGSLIAQGLSGLNTAKIQTIFEIAII